MAIFGYIGRERGSRSFPDRSIKQSSFDFGGDPILHSEVQSHGGLFRNLNSSSRSKCLPILESLFALWSPNLRENIAWLLVTKTPCEALRYMNSSRLWIWVKNMLGLLMGGIQTYWALIRSDPCWLLWWPLEKHTWKSEPAGSLDGSSDT